MPLILCALIVVILFPALPALAKSPESSPLNTVSDPSPASDPLTPALSLQERGNEEGGGEGVKTLDPRSESGMTTGEGSGVTEKGRGNEEVTEAVTLPCRDCGLPYFPPSESMESSAPSPQPSPSGEKKTLTFDQLVQVVRGMVKSGRFPEALAILRQMAVDRPAETEVQFLRGMAATRWSQVRGIEADQRTALLDEAIAAYRSILIRQPDLVRVRLDLALAFFFKQQDGLAREHFERVLVGELPQPVVANVNRFLNVIRARRRWNGYFGFSVAPDTNINAASDASIIYINGLPFRRGQTGRASSDIGVVGWGGGEYQYPLTDRWRLRTGINVNHREYKGSQFDQTFIGGYAGPRWLITRNTEMSLLATASQRWWGGDSFNYDFGARLEVEHRLLPGLWVSGRASWQDRKYQQQRGLEGSLMVFSLGASYVLLPTVRVNSQVGYSQQGALAHRWNSTGYWTRVGTNVALPWGFTVGASAEFRWDAYEDGWFPFTLDNSTPREDQTRILQATLLNRAVTVFGFSPQVAFSNQVRQSNAQLWDYTRNLVEMRWVRQF